MHDLTDDDRARLEGVARRIELAVNAGDIPEVANLDVQNLRRIADKLAQQSSGDQGLREKLFDEEVLDEAEAAYKSSPVGGRRALEAAFKAAVEEAANGR